MIDACEVSHDTGGLSAVSCDAAMSECGALTGAPTCRGIEANTPPRLKVLRYESGLTPNKGTNLLKMDLGRTLVRISAIIFDVGQCSVRNKPRETHSRNQSNLISRCREVRANVSLLVISNAPVLSTLKIGIS